MSYLDQTWKDYDNFKRFAEAVETLGNEKKAKTAFRRALNHTGDKMRTQTRRALAKQTGVPVRRLGDLSALQTKRATYRTLQYSLESTGKHIPLKEFKPRQLRMGVSAEPWAKRRTFEGTFVFAGNKDSGKVVAGGQVFKRTGADSLPVKALFGPAIPDEMTKGATAAAYDRVKRDLGPRVEHEVKQITNGVVS